MNTVSDPLDVVCQCGHPVYEHAIKDPEAPPRDVEFLAGCTLCLCRLQHWGDCDCHPASQWPYDGKWED